MICGDCGEYKEIGMRVDLVTGKKHKKEGGYTHNYGKYKVSTEITTFGSFQELHLWICQDCWRRLYIRKSKKRIVLGIIFAIVGLVWLAFGISCLGAPYTDPSAIYGFAIYPGVVVIIIGLIWTPFWYRDHVKHDYSHMSILDATPETVFKDYKEVMPYIVSVEREGYGVFYWTAWEWKKWMEENIQPSETFASK